MSVFNRISDIINANVNSMLDQAEDPEKVVRMMVAEMQETLVEIKAAAAAQLAEKRKIQLNVKRHKSEIQHWQDKAELAIHRGRDDLAKAAISQRSRIEQALTHAEADEIHLSDHCAKLQVEAKTLEEKIKAARIRQKSLILRGKTAQSRVKLRRQIENVSASGAFDRFDSYERRLEEMEGEVESYDLGNTSLSAELNKLESDERVDDELLKLKAKLETPKLSHQAP